MALVNNYGELKIQVAEVMHRDDLTDQMDNAMNATRSDISQRLESWMNSNFTVLDVADRLDPDGPEYQVPDDFLGVQDIYYGDVVDIAGNISGKEVFGVTNLGRQAQLRKLRAGGTVPVDSYSVSPALDNIRFAVIPPTGTSFVLYYIQQLTVFTNDTDFNFVLLNTPHMYIYGMAKYLAIFVQDIEMSQVYEQTFQQLIDSANQEQVRGRDEGPIDIVGASAWV